MSNFNQIDDQNKPVVPIEEPNLQPIPFEMWPEVMSQADLRHYAGLSHARATELLKHKNIYRPFPKDRRCMLVGKYALRDYLNGREINDCEEKQ